MKKDTIKQIRNKMIKELWDKHQAEWEVSDLAAIFKLSIPQVYRALKVAGNQPEKLDK